ncbi:MAG: protein-signal peptide and transmembrane prediction [Planctomycetota bacterium]
MMEIHPRSRVAVEGGDGEHVSETAQTWDARETAIIVCDMWDDHWCQGAAKRVGELAVPLNRVLENARERGVLVIHSPSTTVSPYEGTPARRRATSAPHVATPAPLSTADRWGTKWCWPDPKKESDLPIDDSDMGCDCEAKCEIRDAWSRQIDLIRIDERDAVSDDGQEVFNVLEERGVENVVLLGVHLNMCVLGRPFGIRQMVNLGKNVVLMRDMTDTMYNSEKKPFVDHFRGTDLVVEHVERHWCPTITSVDFVGGDPFRFREDPVKTSN